jgi:hypothetical protein
VVISLLYRGNFLTFLGDCGNGHVLLVICPDFFWKKFLSGKNFFGHFWEKIWKNGKDMAPW